MSLNTYAVIYRTGGTANFKWCKILRLYDKRCDAEACQEEINRMGYTCIVQEATSLDAVVLPTTFYLE